MEQTKGLYICEECGEIKEIEQSYLPVYCSKKHKMTWYDKD